MFASGRVADTAGSVSDRDILVWLDGKLGDSALSALRQLRIIELAAGP